MELKKPIYYAVTAILWFMAFSTVSAYLAMRGVELPWVRQLEGGYQVNLLIALAFGGLIGVLIAYGGSYLAQKRGNPVLYLEPPLMAIIVVALTVLLLYGGACGYCKKVICSPNPVKECGINARLSWTLFEIKCVCATLIANLLSLL